jgi:signal transduction histidine kinase
MVISARRRTWLQVGRLAVLGILTVSGAFTMNRGDLTTVYVLVAATAVVTALVTTIIMRKKPANRGPYWFLLFIDAILLGTFIYVSGGVDGPFTPFLLIHSLAYGFYLGIPGGLAAALASISATTVFSIMALNVPGSSTTLSPLLLVLVQSGQLKLSSSYIAMRILINGLLLASSGLASGMLAQSLYSLHDGVVVVDADGEIVSINPSAIELLGTEKPMQESSLGRIVNSFLINRDFPPGIDIIVNERVLECRFSQFGDTGGAIIILTDTTDLRNYQAALEERDKLSLIGKLSATMAHEIRNPLASMSGAAQILATGKLDHEKAERMANLIEKQSLRVSELIEGYLSLSRSSSDFPFTEINVNEVIMDSVESAMHGFAGGVSLEVCRSPGDPSILGNRVRLGQVLLNLMRNSVEALSGRHEPLITLEAAVIEDGKSVCITVTDNGPGISGEFLGRIWEPFQTSRDEGTGLGLYIVKRIIEEHGGSVEAENIKEGGALFRIKLPAAWENKNG